MYIRLKKTQPRKLPSKATASDRRAGYTAETDAVKKTRIRPGAANAGKKTAEYGVTDNADKRDCKAISQLSSESF